MNTEEKAPGPINHAPQKHYCNEAHALLDRMWHSVMPYFDHKRGFWETVPKDVRACLGDVAQFLTEKKDPHVDR